MRVMLGCVMHVCLLYVCVHILLLRLEKTQILAKVLFAGALGRMSYILISCMISYSYHMSDICKSNKLHTLCVFFMKNP